MKDVAELVGLALIVAGVAMFSVPVALIVAGVLIVAAVDWPRKPQSEKPDGEQ